jgi:hypothetical protein
VEGNVCNKCGEWKAFDEFYKDKTRKDGCKHYCKMCLGNKKHLPKAIIIYKEKVCIKCGEIKLLEEFRKVSKMKDGHRNDCKKCEKEASNTYNKERLKNDLEYRKRKNSYYKKWRRENPEQVLKNNKRYYQENLEEVLEYKKQYYQENQEAILEYQKQYYQENQEAILDNKKSYWQKNREILIVKNKKRWQKNKESYRASVKEYQIRNKEKIKKIAKEYYENNKDKAYMNNAKRRALKHFVHFSPFKRKQILDRDNWKCRHCGIKVHDRSAGNWNTPDKAHIDHIIPLSKGGDSKPSNLQTLCRTCNLSKKDKIELQLSLF